MPSAVDHSLDLINKQTNHTQTAIGSYIALASENSSATINVYKDILPRPIEPTIIITAKQQLKEMPLEALPTVDFLPLGSRLPVFRHNPLFVGREAYLRQIASLLKEEQPPALIIAGIGGIGKSQLANEVIYRYGRYFAGGVFWLSFADAKSIPTEMAACHVALQQELHLDIKTLSREEQAQLVLSAWQSALPRLLVFDNCEKEQLFVQWRPPVGGCRLLITSRNEVWTQELGGKVISLRETQREESIELLGKYRSGLSDEERAAIAQEVGDLPLALCLAGKFLETYQGSPLGVPAAYLAALQRVTPLQHQSFQEEGVNYSTEHIQHVTHTFALSYEQLDASKKGDEAALMLLSRIACFAPGEPIPREILRGTMGSPDDDQVEDTFVETVKRLQALGLLEQLQQGITYRLHRLLTLFVRQKCGFDPDAQKAVEQALLARVGDLNAAEDSSSLLGLQSHLRVITQEALQRRDAMSAVLSTELGFHLYSIGAYSEALEYYQQALTFRRHVLGEEHSGTATTLNNLALLYEAQGKYEQAEPLCQQALTIQRHMLGEEHSDTAQSLNNLALFYQAQRKPKWVRMLYRRASAIKQRILDKNHRP